jgi:hypothetical protein
MLLGCGVDAASRVPVTGHVKYRGRLLTTGTIVFTPDLDRGTPDELAVGQIQSDGSFALEVNGSKAIAPGWYRVTIVAGFAPDSTMRVALPDRYRDPKRSGLEREVKAGCANVVELDLQ